MKRLFVLLGSLLMVSGCLNAPVQKSGGLGSVTVHDTNATAVMAAAQSVFAARGYTFAGSDFPDAVSFDKPAGAFGNAMWGSYGDPQTIRVKLHMRPVPGTDDMRLSTQVFTVGNAGVSGFDQERPLIGLWNAEFGPMLKEIARRAGD